jgi:hypothetical protein
MGCNEFPHQVSQYSVYKKFLKVFTIYPKLWPCLIDSVEMWRLILHWLSFLWGLIQHWLTWRGMKLRIFWVTVELSKFFIFMRIQEKSQINILPVESGEQWLVDRLRQQQCSHQPTACVGHPRGSCHHLNYMTTEGWRLKGTLTRDILAFFIIFNIKSVFFSVRLRF